MKDFVKKNVLNLTLAIILLCGAVFTTGFGTSLWIARNEVTSNSDIRVHREMDYLQGYVDDQLIRVEDAAYSLASWKFGHTLRDNLGNAHSEIDPNTFVLPASEECYTMMQQFLDANPFIFGIVVGFEPFVYPHMNNGEGFCPYVCRANTESGYGDFDVAEYADFTAMEWYKETKENGIGYWANPYRDRLSDNVVTSFSIPVHGYGGRLVGVLGVVMDTEKFANECLEATPYPNAEVTIVDRGFRFLAHPNKDFLLKDVAETGAYDDYVADDSMKIKILAHESGEYVVTKANKKQSFFYFAPIPRTGWMVSIECPKESVLGGVDRMKRDTTWIAIISILIMVVLLVMLYLRMQSMTESKASVERDLSIASGIQMGMIPKTYPAFPEIPEIDVYGMIKPAKTVGGDLFDYHVRGDRFFFCIGDVSGKGIPASLYMTVVRSLFRNVSLHVTDPSVIATQLNDGLTEGNDYNMFCTMFIGVLNIKTGHLDFCNAGHNHPIIRNVDNGERSVSFMNPKTNLALGVFKGFEFEKEEMELKPGEAIFLYTDGVSEAEDMEKNLFGEKTMLQTLAFARKSDARSSKDFVDFMYNAVQAHARGVDQSDDITMLVVGYRD